MSAKVPIALTIAGLDPSGGAGLQEDIKVFTELGVHGISVATAVTVQSSFGLRTVEPVRPEIVSEQLKCLLEDREPKAAKTGILTNQSLAPVIDFLKQTSVPVIVDPVFASGTGFILADSNIVEVYRTEVIPHSVLVTPNVPELQSLLGMSITSSVYFEGAARKLIDMGAKAVLIKGGHTEEDEVVDLFYTRTQARRFVKPRRNLKRVHGTGCALSAAIVAYLVRGATLLDAVASAEAYIDRKLADVLYAGEGAPIINHLKSVS